MYKARRDGVAQSRASTTADPCAQAQSATGADGTETIAWRAALHRQVLPLMLAIFCVYLARERFSRLDTNAVWAALRDVSAGQWLAALIATGTSFWALGHYDALMHRALRTGTPTRSAAWAGMAAIAISQTVGLGLVTGSLVRWRLLPGLSLGEATKLTLAVTASFLTGWVIVTAVAIRGLLPIGVPYASMLHVVATLVLVVTGVGIGLCLWQPAARTFGTTLRWPPVLLVGRILGLTTIDTVAAGLALYFLLPAGSAPELAHFLPAFLLALGAGLILGTPGGIGPFELILMAMLPDLQAEPLIAAILSYRALYFALPASVAGLLLALGTADAPSGAATADTFFPDLTQASRAEVQLYRQGGYDLLRDPLRADGWLTGRAGQVLVGLFDPINGTRGAGLLLPALCRAAKAEGRLAALYKISARSAVRARRAGWCVRPIAVEYWLTPAGFTPAGPSRATLRRKLRHAAAAGITVTAHAPGTIDDLPWASVARIADHWAARRSGELGFSMGRFAPAYLAGQRLYLAWAGGQLVGFASFHQGQREWTLDLMRQLDGVPDGTMHSLIVRAIEDAAAASVKRLSLAAGPLPGWGVAWLGAPKLGTNARLAHLTGARATRHCRAGLIRFKESFAPSQSRLYLAAPTRAGLLLAAGEITRAIHYPARLPQPHVAGAGSLPSHRLPKDTDHDLS